MGETELDVARIRLRSAWKAVDEATTPEQRQELFKRADALQAEIVAAENPPHPAASWRSDQQRELKWWEDQYAAKLSDMFQDNGRAPATMEELSYFEDKIIDLSGQVSRVSQTDPVIEVFNRRIQDWVALERRLESIFEEDRAEERTAARMKAVPPIYRPFAPEEVRAGKILGAYVLAAVVIFISTLYLWA